MIDLKVLRKESGFTQEEIAHLLGIKQQQYARYEKGITKITFEMLKKILNVCGYDFKLVKKSKKGV